MEDEGTGTLSQSMSIVWDDGDHSSPAERYASSPTSPIVHQITTSSCINIMRTPTTSNMVTGRTVGVVAGTIRKLDDNTSSIIRKAQVINKVSDVVRELVENSVDSDCNSIQVILSNFGLDKIEVRDNGRGIAASELSQAVSGGFTSKLNDTGHLSLQSYYGFRGEALSSICTVAEVSITTKTSDDTKTTKYMLDDNCSIISEAIVAGGNGTIVVATKLFEKYPVRRKWSQDKKKRIEELKEIETFLKSVAIANPQIRIRLLNDSNQIWVKASAISMDQALVTVLGHNISKNLGRCGPLAIEVPEGDGDRTIEAFFVKKPVDMKTMSFTKKIMTFIFVNRKRVDIHKFEKLIQRYTVATIAKPAPADRRRYPAAVVNIKVPNNEVDFNREMDKSKVFMIHKDQIYAKLEELLQLFYEIPALLDDNLEAECQPESTRDSAEQISASSEVAGFRASHSSRISDTIIHSHLMSNPLPPQEEEIGRRNAINSFMANIPITSGTNFTQSPVKKSHERPISVEFPSTKHSPKKSIDRLVPSDINVDDPPRRSPSPIHKSKQCISNFELNFDDIFMDTPPDGDISIKDDGNKDLVTFLSVQESSKEVVISDEHPVLEVTEVRDALRTEKSASRTRNENESEIGENVREINMDHWLKGRIPDSHGNVLQSVNIINRPPISIPIEVSCSQQFSSQNKNNSRNTSFSSAFDFIGSGLEKNRDPKRPRLQDNRLNQRNSSSQFSILPGTPRQITLNQYKTWDTPTPTPKKRKSSENVLHPVQSNTGVRLITPPPSSISLSPTSFPNSKRNTSRDEVHISMKDILNQGSRSQHAAVQIADNLSCPQNHGRILGVLSDASLYSAKINDFVGVFHPMNMLHEFPKLRYDLNITCEKVSDPRTELHAQYVVTKEGVTKLFNELLLRVNPTCDQYPKIFHQLYNLKNDSHEEGGGFFYESRIETQFC